MRIAICDDDMQDLRSISALVKSYQADTMEISGFTAADDVYAYHIRKPFDLAILDIEMPDPNGYVIAEKLQKREDRPLILFATNSSDYTIRGYGVAFRYLQKPITKESLFPVLDAAVREVSANRFVFEAGRCSHVLRLDEIFYIESFRHSLILHTADNAYEFRSSLAEAEKRLPAGCFAKPNQGCLVNMRQINKLGPEFVFLTNGECISISRRRQKEFISRFHQFLRR